LKPENDRLQPLDRKFRETMANMAKSSEIAPSHSIASRRGMFAFGRELLVQLLGRL
jgi:hypothetical protein